jgi:hypothetical protein
MRALMTNVQIAFVVVTAHLSRCSQENVAITAGMRAASRRFFPHTKIEWLSLTFSWHIPIALGRETLRTTEVSENSAYERRSPNFYEVNRSMQRPSLKSLTLVREDSAYAVTYAAEALRRTLHVCHAAAIK